MDLIDMFKKVGIDNMEYQTINNCAINSKKCKHDNEITFPSKHLSPENLINGTGKIGIVVWLDRDKVEGVING